MTTTLLTLPPHLLQTISEILAADTELTSDIKAELSAATNPTPTPDITSNTTLTRTLDNEDGEGDADGDENERDEITPPTIDVEVIERLSRWATTDEGSKQLIKAHLDPSNYQSVSLLAGTEVYISPREVERIRAATNPNKHDPFLPSYLSTPTSSTISKDLQSLSKQISTILNILFSIFGSSSAVYIASTSGAGYTQETALLLAIATGVIVGIADAVLVWIFVNRLQGDRIKQRENARIMNIGSAAIKDEQGRTVEILRVEEKVIDKKDQDHIQDEEADESARSVALNASAVEKPTIRLRRKALDK